MRVRWVRCDRGDATTVIGVENSHKLLFTVMLELRTVTKMIIQLLQVEDCIVFCSWMVGNFFSLSTNSWLCYYSLFFDSMVPRFWTGVTWNTPWWSLDDCVLAWERIQRIVILDKRSWSDCVSIFPCHCILRGFSVLISCLNFSLLLTNVFNC